MPRNRSEAQMVMRRFGITGLKVDAIQDNRIFCLTREMLHEDNTMRRQARTVILEEDGDDMRAVYLYGWVVHDNRAGWHRVK